MPIATSTIFVADDNVAILQGVKRALSATGYEVETAENGRAALDLLRSAGQAPDLLLLDVMMPEVSGLQVLEAMRADPRLSQVPVLLITATTDEAIAAAVASDGCVELLAKPFRLDQLLAGVASRLKRGRRGAEAASAPVEPPVPTREPMNGLTGSAPVSPLAAALGAAALPAPALLPAPT